MAGRIDALDYVSIDHSLLPPLRARSANSVMAITNRVRYCDELQVVYFNQKTGILQGGNTKERRLEYRTGHVFIYEAGERQGVTIATQVP
jgi:hypothetical protein